MGTFNRETDIAWDAQDNSYVSDGYGNSRVVKIAKDGTWVKVVGTTVPARISSLRLMASPRTRRHGLCRRPRQLPHPGL